MDNGHRRCQINCLVDVCYMAVDVVADVAERGMESACVASFVADEASYAVDAFSLFVDACIHHAVFAPPIVSAVLAAISAVAGESVLVGKSNPGVDHTHQAHPALVHLPLLHCR